MIHLHTLTNKELESRARAFAEKSLPHEGRLQVLILALCDRLAKPNLEPRERAVRVMK
jgi:hypothetical protein